MSHIVWNHILGMRFCRQPEEHLMTIYRFRFKHQDGEVANEECYEFVDLAVPSMKRSAFWERLPETGCQAVPMKPSLSNC